VSKHITKLEDNRNPDDAVLANHVRVIRELGRRVYDDVIDIGGRLTECQKLVPHREWASWLKLEFGWSADTALNFMRVHELAKSRNFRALNLPVSAIYLLAKPSTPNEARDEVEALATAVAGEKVTVEAVKDIISKAKDTGRKPPLRPTESERRAAIKVMQETDLTGLVGAARGNDLEAEASATTRKAIYNKPEGFSSEAWAALSPEAREKLIYQLAKPSTPDETEPEVFSPETWAALPSKKRTQIIKGWGPSIVDAMSVAEICGCLSSEKRGEFERRATHKASVAVDSVPMAPKQREAVKQAIAHQNKPPLEQSTAADDDLDIPESLRRMH
jgi:Protein of unknown function (DUF3102)